MSSGLPPSASPTATLLPAWCAPTTKPKEETSSSSSARALSPSTASRCSPIRPTAQPMDGSAASSPRAISKPRKANADLTFEEILAASEGQILIALPPPNAVRSRIQDRFAQAGTSGITFTARLSALARAAPRPHLPRRRALSSRRRAAPARAIGRTRRPARRAARRRQRCFLSRRRTPAARRRAHLRARKMHARRSGPAARRQCRTASQTAGGNGAAVRQFSRRHRPHRRDRASLPLLARRTQIRISRRAGAGRQDRTAASRRSHLGGRAGALSARPISARHSRRRAKPAARRAHAHRQARLCALFPHRPRRRRLCPQSGKGNPLPGPRLGGQQRGVLLPRHHRR